MLFALYHVGESGDTINAKYPGIRHQSMGGRLILSLMMKEYG
jgi:hypothetical protein